MPITYNETKKDLPCGQLRDLFITAGWCGAENDEYADVFNRPFIGSTFVVSAWDGDRQVGAVRALSDGILRSVVYDLIVDPGYQGKGIGGELLRRLRAKCPNSEWTL